MSKFKVGDRVRIRSWESMKREFGLDRDGDIDSPVVFTTGMQEYCGSAATISGLNGDGVYFEDDSPVGRSSYCYTTDMIEPAEFEVGQIYRVGKLSHQHEWEDAIIRLAEKQMSGFKIKSIRGEAPADFMNGSGYAHSLTLLTGPQIGEAIRKWDVEHSANKTGAREVKRPAKPGEYIKIVSVWANVGYKNGDILKVIRRFNENSVVFDDTKICVCDDEYVVLEGYKPEKEEHRKAKVGDTIKVLRDNGGRVKPGTVWTVKSVDTDGTLRIVHADDEITWLCNKDNYIVVSSSKHSYTAEQVAEAKKLCGEMMVEAFDDGNAFNLRFLDTNRKEGDKKVECELARLNMKPDSKETATCSDHDEYNVWIGRCVALCKALHKPIPAFITGNGKGRHFSLEKAKRLAYDEPHHEIGIHCKTQDEIDQLMRELEKLGYTWSGGEKPTEYHSDAPYRFINDVGKTILKDESACGQPCAEFSDCFTED